MRRICLLLALASLLTCRPRESPEVVPVILISVDTLRSDRLPAYGYGGIETPAFDAFRRDAILFERAYSQSPLTLPSHATLLTGLLPAAHGVRDNVGFRVRAKPEAHLASILRQRGYATAAAVSAFVLRAQSGIAAGFDTYDDAIDRTESGQSIGAVQRRGEVTIAIAQRWLAAHGSRPFFYFLHLYEPHTPYDAPESYRARGRHPYDAEVVYTDALLGRFLDFLKQRGIYDRALIVVTSDHGEGLGDHGEDEHGIFLYREAIQVPLLIKLPSSARGGEIVKTPVGLVDVAPMIMQTAGGDALTAPSRPVYSETWYPRFHFGWSELHSLVADDEHLIEAPRAELYDVLADPAERRNLASERRRRFAAMRTALAPLVQKAEAPSAISREDAEKLAALGYIGAAASVSGPLPDPKDKIATFRELREAFALYREGRDAEALRRFEAILAANPNMIDVWDVRAKTLFRMGRIEESIASGKEALKRSPSSTHLAIDLANAMLLEGDLEDASQHAQLAAGADPAGAHELLARIALLRGDLSRAEAEARLAVSAPGNSNAARYTLARVEQRKGNHAEVVRISDELLARLRGTGGRPLHGLNAMRGDALARTGRVPEAEAALRQELRLYPHDPEASRALIVLLASQGRNAEASAVVRELAAAVPNRTTYSLIADTLEVLGDRDGARYWRTRK